LQSAVQSLGVSSTAVEAVVLYNQKIAASGSLASVFSTQLVIQGPVAAGLVTSSSNSFTSIMSTLTGSYQDLGITTTEVTEANSASDISTSGQLGSLSGVTNPAWTFNPSEVTGTYGVFKVNPNGSWTFTANGPHNELAAGQSVSQSIHVKSVAGQATETITVHITGTNDGPNTVPTLVGATEGGGLVSVNGLQGASDPDNGATLTIVPPNSFPAGVAYDSSTGNFSIDPTNAFYKHLANGQTASVQVSYGVSDGTVTTNAMITFTVTGTNNAPTVSAISNTNATDGGQVVYVDALSGASDVDDSSTLSVVTANLPDGVTYESSGHRFRFDPSNTVYARLAVGESSTITVNYLVSDGIASTPSSVSFIVAGSNQAPSVVALGALATEGGSSVTVNALQGANDVDDGTVLSVDVSNTVLPVGVTYNSASHSFTLDPSNAAFTHLAAGVSASVSVSYLVSDGAASTSNTLTFQVTGANNAPTVTAITASALEAGSSVSVDPLQGANDFDDGDLAKLTVVNVVQSSLPTGVTYDAALHKFVIDPTNAAFNHLGAGETRSVTVNYLVSDGIATTPNSITFNVGSIISANGLDATLPGVVGDWDIQPSIVITGAGQSSDGFIVSKHSDASLAFKIPSTVTSLHFKVGGTTNATLGLSHVSGVGFIDDTGNSAGPHSLSVASGALESAVIVESKAGNQNIYGTLDSTSSVSNFRSDSLKITDAASSSATFTTSADNQTITLTIAGGGTKVLKDIESVQFTDKTIRLVGASGYANLDEAKLSASAGDGFYFAPLTINNTTTVAAGNVSTASALDKSFAGHVDVSVAQVAGISPAGFALQSPSVGSYGALSLNASTGAWSYALDDTLFAVKNLGKGSTLEDTFTVRALDSEGGYVDKSVVITVVGSNVAPSPFVSVDKTEGADFAAISATGSLNTSGSGVVQVEPISNSSGKYGTFNVLSNGQWTFTANGTHSELTLGQKVSQSVEVKDQSGVTVSYITVNITGINNTPTITGAYSTTVTETDAASALNASGKLTIVDADLNQSSFQPVSSSGTYGTFTLGADGTWVFAANGAHNELAKDQQVSQSVNALSLDGTASQTITVNLVGTNDAPSVTALSSGATEGGGSVVVNALSGAGDVDGGTTLSVVNVVLATLPAGVTYNASSRNFTIDPTNAAYKHLAAGQTTTVSVSYAVSDGVIATPNTLSFTITGTNNSPVVTALSAGATEAGASVTVDALQGASDFDDGASLSVVNVPTNLPAGVTYNAANHSFSINPANSAYTHLALGQTTDVVVNFGVSDGTTTTSNTVTFKVTGVNNAATVSSASAAVTEGNLASNLNAAGILSVVDPDDGESKLIAQTVAGTYGTFVVNANGSWTFTGNDAHNELVAGQVVSQSLQVRSQDQTATGLISVNITGTNDVPTITSQTKPVTQGNAAADISTSGKITVTDLDGAGTQNFVQPITSSGSYGTFVVYSDGSWVFTANGAHKEITSAQQLSQSVNVTSLDGSATGTITVNFLGSNDIASLSSATASVTETNSAASLSASGKLSVTDPDLDESFVQQQTSSGTYGTFAVDINGNWTFVGNDAHNELTTGQVVSQSATVLSKDGSASGTITVNITGTNDVATVTSSTKSVSEGDLASNLDTSGSVTVTDPDTGESHTRAATSRGTYGTFAIDTNGQWSFVGNGPHNELAKDQQVSQSMSVTSQDGTGAGTVSVTITGTNDAPVIAPATIQFQQGQAAIPNLYNIAATATDVDGPLSEIRYLFATHQDGDADYSQFTINPSTGQISLTPTGAQAIAADAIRSDYILHVQAQDNYGYGLPSDPQAIDIHVNMAIDNVHKTATLPGAMSDWDIEPILKPDETGESSVSDGYLMINHADPLIAIRVPADVPLLNFSDGTQLTLSNSATSATGTITDTSIDVSKNHYIKIADGTTENTIIELLPNGKYTITGASDTVVDPDLGPATNFRSDTLMVNVNQSQASFTKVGNNLQMVINANGATGTVLMNEIEAIHFKDKTVLVAAPAASNLSTVFNSFNGFSSLDDADKYLVAHPNDIFVPLSDVYPV
jgi:VCBS repeat-containing protein